MRLSILSPNFKRLAVMKKIYIALAVVVTALLSSCVKEQNFDELTPIGENGIGFVIQNAATRSMEANPEAAAQRGISIPVGVDSKGEPLFLEETIENLNPAPATKGAPAYTVNVGTLFTTMGVYAAGKFGDATFHVLDETMHSNPNGGQGWRYSHSYSSSPWPTNDEEKVDFYLRMPAASGINDETLDYSTKGSIAFDFASFESGKDQQDVLFGYTSISKKEHDGFLPKGAPVTMLHALTGVKFRSGSENGNETKTIITKVEFIGLNGAGHCVVTPASNSVVWTNLTPGAGSYVLEFDNPTYSKTAWADGTIGNEGGTQWNSNYDNTSWTAAAADHNLNNADGELTFWFPAQEISDDVILKVTFCVKTPDTSGASGGGFEEHVIKFGELLNKGRTTPVKWEAGQLRTYTLNPKLVDVEIFDSMVNLTKSGLHVTNTGNVSEYVRMMVIGNWYGWASQDDADAGKEPMILVGYTDADPANTEMVTPWFREDATYGSYFDDSFTGGKPQGDNEWVFGTGSYFYYPNIIGPQAKLAETSALFQSYTLPANKIPTIYIPTSSSSTRVPAVGVHLVMEVVIQAIGAQKPDGSGNYATWQEAWTAAVGKEIKEKN